MTTREDIVTYQNLYRRGSEMTDAERARWAALPDIVRGFFPHPIPPLVHLLFDRIDDAEAESARLRLTNINLRDLAEENEATITALRTQVTERDRDAEIAGKIQASRFPYTVYIEGRDIVRLVRRSLEEEERRLALTP
jgi:hypothetical protein